MTKYKCLSRQNFQDQSFEFIPIRQVDMSLIREWRNEQIDILRQSEPISKEQQERYYTEEIKPLFDANQPEQILFSILNNGVCIGYGGLTHIDWTGKEAEISFLLETNKNQDIPYFKKTFNVFLTVVKEVAFFELCLRKLHTETYDIRPYVIEVLEKSGFILEKRLDKKIRIGEEYIDVLFHGCLKES